MEKTIGAFDIRRQFGQIIQEVLSRGDRFVVERHGQPVAALVPMEVYEQWKRSRDQYFAHLEQVAQRTDLSSEEAEQLAAAAVQDARRQS